MRLSTNTIYELSLASMTSQQNLLQKTQQQISTGKRILTPSDDPIAAAQVLNIAQRDSINSQYATNRITAQDSLALSETALGGVTDLIQSVRESAVSAGNGAMTNTDRKILADALLSNQLQELIGMANATDSSGRYLFSGYQGATKPFSQDLDGLHIQYNGDQGQRMVQAASSRQIPLSDSGSNIFESVKSGNGSFVTAAGESNKGSGVVGTGSVVDPVALNGSPYAYQITFVGSSGRYYVSDTTTMPPTILDTTKTPISACDDPTTPPLISYVSGGAISLPGLQFDITGSPAAGDTFTVNPSSKQSLFTTVVDLIEILKKPVLSPADSTKLTNGLNAALQGLDNGLDHVLVCRSSVGSRQNEVDSLQSIGADLGQQYQKSMSQLQDVDYAKAISDLSKQQANLEAAQKTFNKVSGLSLFNYM